SSHTPTLPIEAIQKRLWQCSEATIKPIQTSKKFRKLMDKRKGSE
ncbi:7761_t:CDS:2, partial [Gigaspora rosea]